MIIFLIPGKIKKKKWTRVGYKMQKLESVGLGAANENFYGQITYLRR